MNIKFYCYYCIARPVSPGAVPRMSKIVAFDHFIQRQYVPEIDRMAWGWVAYSEPLTPAEISNYELISAPREVECNG